MGQMNTFQLKMKSNLRSKGMIISIHLLKEIQKRLYDPVFIWSQTGDNIWVTQMSAENCRYSKVGKVTQNADDYQSGQR